MLVLRSPTTKAKKTRRVPVPEFLHPILESLPFSDVDAGRLYRDFVQAREKAGLPDVHMHDLRHSYATWLAKDPNVPITVIRDVLGHSSLQMTSRYANLREEHLRSVFDALPELEERIP
jgi:integrase